MALNSSTSRDSTLVSISNVIDVADIEKTDVNSKEFKSIIKSLADNVNNMLISINAKDIGIYESNETLAGQNFFNDSDTTQSQRPVYRKVINFGALAGAAGNTQVAHDLDAAWPYKFTRIYGVTSDLTNRIGLPIPYASSTAADIIELYVDDTYINITVGKDRSTFTTTYVVIEYLET